MMIRPFKDCLKIVASNQLPVASKTKSGSAPNTKIQVFFWRGAVRA
jgi:hypothetical protein